MFVIRMIVIGVFLAGLLAGIGALADNGVPRGITGTVLVIAAVFVGLRMVGGLFARSANENTYRESSSRSRPAFKVLEEGKDANGRPYMIIQGNSQDASRVTDGRKYPGANGGMGNWTHTHIGHYKWKIHLEN
jgi:hypothetical protein